jgi:hemerythrin-like domain-containing protein
MLRDKSLVPLSRQHQHALALCVRIDRASPIAESDRGQWQVEIAQHFRGEIRIHFDAEEQIVFRAARKLAELNSLIAILLNDHEWLRERFAKAEEQALAAVEITEFAKRLSGHIRREERELFERLQQVMSKDELAVMGQELERALKEAEQACAVPARNVEN